MNETQKIGNYRYRILGLLMFATTINYFDRSIIGVLYPTLQKLFGWTNSDYAGIIIWFQIAYAIGMLAMGGVIDRLGTKKGYTLAIGTWSFFGVLHAFVQPGFSILGFSVARFGLGIGESGNFPAAQKTVAEWFPKKDRAFATGLYNAATSIGAIAAPFVIGWIVHENGKNWQIPFLITGALSAIWVFLWFRIYKKPEVHPSLSKGELAYIQSDSKVENEDKLPWKQVFFKRETWAFAVAKMTDAVWWFYLFWGAKYLSVTFGVDVKSIGVPFFVIYAMADVGSIFGGYLSGFFIKKGWSINKARKSTLLICALIILPVAIVAITQNKWLAVFLIGLGAAGHQAWSANIFTLASDVFPKKAVASVTGIGGMSGAVAGIISSFLLGKALDSAGNTGFFWAFLVAGSCYLVILGLVHLLMPKMTPLDENLNYIVE
ncbi:MFS transporter [Thalassobellus sediminis]|uniref:MFS transporter n=1 Tax=Thalassobellus sediminis TaxID=3367753 RepID=UPI0037B3F4F1